MAIDLSTVYLGGNKTSSSGMALSQSLKQMRDGLSVVWKPQLHGATWPQRRLVTIGVGVGVGVRVMAAAPLGTGLSERSACV